MKKIVIISGPTASGKTSLGFYLAKKFKGEIVSADSRQIYKGMDIVTGKELDPVVKTWLVDAVNPDEEFSVFHFYDLAWRAINAIWSRNTLPIIVGGTGFYMKAILDGIGTMDIKPDWNLREELGKLSLGQLQKRLEGKDEKRWQLMNKSDRNNPRRLVRAIEVAGKKQHENVPQKPDFLWIGLTASFPVLYERIDQRVDERLKMGALEETRILSGKYGWDIPSMSSQGYRELRGTIESRISIEEAVQKWKFAEHKYARKQMTWFKKEKRIAWFDIGDRSFKENVVEKILQWYT